MNKNKNKKIMAALLAGTMIVTSVTPAMAETAPSSKEEVIYVNNHKQYMNQQ